MNHAIEADDGNDSHSIGDSGYDDTLCSSDSLRSSVFAYERENGRTYHAFHAGKYHVPNDEGEQERMDIHYHALRLSIGDKIFHAPIQDPQSILDVGAGTGIWAMDAADTYPGAQVIGFDLSPIQPTTVPPNLTFEVSDLDDSWDYGDGRFDLVHTRFMNGFSIKNWDHVYREAYSSLKPGGWVENQEFDCQVLADDGTIPPDSRVQEWVKLWNQGMEMIGMTGRCNPEVLAQKMRDTGFVNVHIKHYKMPIGPWPKDPMLKEAGVYGLVAIIDGMSGLSMKVFTKLLGWSVEALEVFLVEVRKEFKRRSIHSYWPSFIILGQKPEQAQVESFALQEAIQPTDAFQDSANSGLVEAARVEPMHVEESPSQHQTKEPEHVEPIHPQVPPSQPEAVEVEIPTQSVEQAGLEVGNATQATELSKLPNQIPASLDRASHHTETASAPVEQTKTIPAEQHEASQPEQVVTAPVDKEKDLNHTDYIS